MHMLHSSCSKSSARPATNRRNAMRRAEANAKWGSTMLEDSKRKLCSSSTNYAPASAELSSFVNLPNNTFEFLVAKSKVLVEKATP